MWPYVPAMYAQTNVGLLCCVGSGSNVGVLLGRGYVGVRTDTTQQSGQTPDKEVTINHITVYVSGYTETNTTGMLSPNNGRMSGANKVGFVSSRQSDQMPAAVCIEFECCCNRQNRI